MLFFPAFIFVTTTIFFSLLYVFSRNSIFSAAGTFGYLASGLDGRQSLFGGTSFLILFSIIILSYLIIRDKSKLVSEYLILIIFGVSLIYINYNRSAISILLMLKIIFYLAILKIIGSNNIHKNEFKNNIYGLLDDGNSQKIFLRLLFSAFIIISVFHIYFHSFIKEFIPYFLWATKRGYTGWDLFASMWLEEDATSIPVGELIFQTPNEIVYISIVKYAIVLVSLVLFSGWITYSLWVKKSIDEKALVILSFTTASAVFSIIKTLTGSPAVQYAVIPGVLATAWFMYRSSQLIQQPNKKLLKAYCSIFIILFILTSGLYYPLALNNDMVSDSKENYMITETPAKWHAQYVRGQVRTDEFTSNLFRLHTLDAADVNSMTGEEVYHLVFTEDKSESEIYYSLNNNLNRVYIGGWQRIKPWMEFSDKINNNRNLDKIYTTKSIVTYK